MPNLSETSATQKAIILYLADSLFKNESETKKFHRHKPEKELPTAWTRKVNADCQSRRAVWQQYTEAGRKMEAAAAL